MAKEMSVEELRSLIAGQQEFNFDLANDIGLTMRELTQEDLNIVEQELVKRFKTPPSEKEYNDKRKILKLAYAIKEFRHKGEVLSPNGFDQLSVREKFLEEFGEGVILGLHLNYEAILGEKFATIKKKSLEKTE